jgi:dTDP-4-dehydrorhamnose 3,5-epimerase
VVRGSVFDVAVDVRPDSPTYLRHVEVELTARSLRALYVPTGFAHGYQTCADDTEMLYVTSQLYSPTHERGLRHDDPALAIIWPLPVSVISDKDARWALVADDHTGSVRAR